MRVVKVPKEKVVDLFKRVNPTLKLNDEFLDSITHGVYGDDVVTSIVFNTKCCKLLCSEREWGSLTLIEKAYGFYIYEYEEDR